MTLNQEDYYEMACDLNSGDACFNVAIIYRGGFGVEKSRVKEKEFYKKGCDAGLKAGCDLFVDLGQRRQRYRNWDLGHYKKLV